MSFELDNDTGTIFKNKDKSSDKHPDYTGKIKLDGTERQIALWLRESKNGTKYMFAKVSDFQAKEEKKEPVEEFSDEIPF